VVDGRDGLWLIGIRYCSNPECNAVVFFARDPNSGVARILPPEALDWDATNLPDNVRATFEEAITCQSAACYRAAAAMVRRTLEVVCEDQGATDGDLKQRIRDLGTRVVIPQALLDGMDSLRLLGNDAVHVQLKHFDDVGADEATIAIEFTKEILKAVYQLSGLVARLDQLRQQASGTS
jgi:hypothetical protein